MHCCDRVLCAAQVRGCTDANALNYDAAATVNQGCDYPVPGCMDPTARNFAPDANQEVDAAIAALVSPRGHTQRIF